MVDIIAYYKKQGAPADQFALVSLLKELQEVNGGYLNGKIITQLSDALNVKESFLLAIIKRYPSLKISSKHLLEICNGPNCGKHKEFLRFIRELQEQNRDKLDIKYGNCMRLCAKGPNIRWDGTTYHYADQKLIRKLLKDI